MAPSAIPRRTRATPAGGPNGSSPPPGILTGDPDDTPTEVAARRRLTQLPRGETRNIVRFNYHRVAGILR